MMNQDEQDGKFGNFILVAISLILIAAVMVGYDSLGKTPKSHPESASTSREPLISPQSSPISSQKSLPPAGSPALPTLETICSQTDYIPTCRNSLASVLKQSNATLQDYVETAVDVTIQHMKSIVDLSKHLSDNSGIKEDHVAINDCNELMSLGIDNLEAVQSVVSNSSDLLKENFADFKNSLSAVIAYQQACLDGFTDHNTKSEMANALQKPKKMASNALAIVDSIFKTKYPSKDVKARRLLSDTNFGREGYPPWFSAKDRKLLEAYNHGGLQPDVVVAADGSGQFKTIGEALNAYKLNSKGQYVIYVKAGHYTESVTVTKEQTNVYMYGDGPYRTIVSGSKYSMQGFPTYQTATFAVIGKGFVCKQVAFQNSAKSKQEAVALRVQADKAAFFNCKIEGSQATLYALAHRQFYRECIIIGSKDIILGDSSTIIQKSQILVRRPSAGQTFNTITAQGRTERRETTGFVLHNCIITRDQEWDNKESKIPTYLGRPWRRHSRTIIMQSYIGDVIDRKWWTMDSIHLTQEKLFYAEYENKGPGASTNERTKWKGYKIIIDKSEALKYTPRYFIQGDLWLNRTGVPFEAELL